MLTIQRNIKNAGKQICRRSQSIVNNEIKLSENEFGIAPSSFSITFFCESCFTMHKDDSFIKFEVL